MTSSLLLLVIWLGHTVGNWLCGTAHSCCSFSGFEELNCAGSSVGCPLIIDIPIKVDMLASQVGSLCDHHGDITQMSSYTILGAILLKIKSVKSNVSPQVTFCSSTR